MVRDVFGCAKNPLNNKMEEIYRLTYANANNMSFQVITLGATITTLFVPDKDGQFSDITLGYDDVAGYQTATNPYIGCTVGRVCSRVGNGKFQLDGKTYEVTRNLLNKHQLHGGLQGLSKLHWQIAKLRPDGVELRVCSPEGHEGYPGAVNVTLHLTLSEDNCLKMHFEATTNAPTPVNLCNHAYFNLAGHNTGAKTMYEHMAYIKASQMTEKDADTVPTGKYLSVANTPYDCREWKNVGAGIKEMAPNAPGYDDNYCLELEPQQQLTTVAKMYHPNSGRMMEIISDQPAMHFYTSHNMPDVANGAYATIIGKGGAKYEKHSSFCMETSGYPDAVNHSNFPSVILRPGELYSHKCIFKFTVKSA